MKQLEGLKADEMAGFVKEDSVYLLKKNLDLQGLRIHIN
jgi:hypothetical protein